MSATAKTYRPKVLLGKGSERHLRRHLALALKHKLPDGSVGPMLVDNPMPAPGTLLALRVRGRLGETLRAYHVTPTGAFVAKGLAVTKIELAMAQPLPRALLSRRLSDRSKYSPRTCFAQGHA